jgi:predicted acyltransferase
VLTRWTVAHGESLKGVIYRATFASWLRPCCSAEAASLGYAVAYVVLWGLILGEMYRRRLFIGV